VQVITDRPVEELRELTQTMLLISRVGSSLGSAGAVVTVRVAGKDKTPLLEIPKTVMVYVVPGKNPLILPEVLEVRNGKAGLHLAHAGETVTTYLG